MKYYLIDYENVNAAGLEGIDEISPDSRVVLFYTKNSSKIDLGVFNLLRTTSAELAVIEVHHGKQALDIQLGSYVGFLIGTEPADTEYYIVSKDKGYRNIQDFWSDRRIVLCTSLREDSEIVDEPKPARSGSRSSSRGGRSRSSAKAGKSDAKAGKSDEKAEKNEPAGKSAKSEPADKPDHAEEKSSGKKGSRSRSEKNGRKDKHEKVEMTSAAHPAEEVKADAPDAPDVKDGKSDAPDAKNAPSEAAPNAFAEAAALAAAMAAAKSEHSENDAILTTAAQTEPAGSGSKEAEPEKKSGKKGRKSSAKKTADAKKTEDAKADEESGAKKESSKGTKAKEKKTEKKAEKKAEPKTEKKSEKKAEKKADKKAEKKAEPKASEIRNEANTEIQKILSKEGFPGDVINATASFVSKNIGKDGYRQLIYRGIIKDHGQKQGLAIYRLIKGVL